MRLASGVRLGPYELREPLGAGGMGEVWRARDTRLDRDVALKVVPEELVLDRERMARFEEEARVLASLNHPHIATCHGVEESGPVRALVMELIAGPTLAERLTQGSIPVTEALTLARQAAEALACAHDHGIVHRDLKPANVKITPQGDVKVLDFGLAKATMPGDARNADVADSPTRTRWKTEAGVLVGTAPYMSPEQARGEAIDKRTDVWAFGVILFEMLTGRPLFDGPTPSDVLAAVLRGEVDWSWLPDETPVPVRRLLRRCLSRDPRQRLRDMADARLEVDEALRGPDVADGVEPARRSVAGWRGFLPYAGALAAVALALGFAIGRRGSSVPPRLSRLSLRLVPPPQADGGIAISPDGARLAYVAKGGVQVRTLDDEEARPLLEARGRRPSFSPDGEWIAFIGADGLLAKVPARGGPVVRLTERRLGLGQCTWLANETILCTQPESQRPGELLRIPSRGGSAVPVPTASQAARERVRWPHALPDGQAVLLTVTGPSGGEAADAAVAVQRLDTGERRVLVEGGAEAVYARTGHLVYIASGSLMVAAFDARSQSLRGEPLPLAERISTDNLGAGRYALARDGTLVYRKPSRLSRPLLLVDRQGAATRIPAPDHMFIDPRVSPNSSRIAVQAADSGSDIWVHELARGALTRLTFDPQEDETPVWSPDGTSIAWAAQRSGRPRQVRRRSADGSGEEQVVWSTPAHVHVHDWSPDGQALLVTQDAAATARDIWLVPAGGGEARALLAEPFDEWNPRFSPDGRWLAYTSNESGRFEIYVRRFPELDGRLQVSVGGGDGAAWADGGRELVYRGGEGRVVSVRFSPEAGAAPRVSAPRELFADVFGAASGLMSHPDYDVFPDGSRFVMLGGQGEDAAELSIVLGWFEELRRIPR
ncbi:MAG TPA: protein kinase [Vicinamibacteria bacterium]|nr:protein kinase [Vicinamibacteria bacterium]